MERAQHYSYYDGLIRTRNYIRPEQSFHDHHGMQYMSQVFTETAMRD